MKARKLSTLALTGALALGGLGIGSMADLPIPGMQATQADAAGTHSSTVTGGTGHVHYDTLNAIRTSAEIYTTDDGNFLYGEPRFIIKNSVGTVVKVGSMNPVENTPFYLFPGWVWSTATTNISLAGLPKNSNHYRIEFTFQASDKTMTVAQLPGLTWAFTYNADGSVTNIRE